MGGSQRGIGRFCSRIVVYGNVRMEKAKDNISAKGGTICHRDNCRYLTYHAVGSSKRGAYHFSSSAFGGEWAGGLGRIAAFACVWRIVVFLQASKLELASSNFRRRCNIFPASS